MTLQNRKVLLDSLARVQWEQSVKRFVDQLDLELSALTPTSGIGTYLNTFTPAGSAVSLSSNVGKTSAVLLLTPGDWDVNGSGYFSPDATASFTRADVSVSTVTNTPAAVPDITFLCWPAFMPGVDFGVPTPTRRLVLSVNTTVYLVSRALFSGGLVSAYGQIRARKVA